MKTLPAKMLRDAATLIIPQAVTGWHAVDGTRAQALGHVHVQRSAALDINEGYDGELADRPDAKLWFDCRLSTPHGLDFMSLQRQAMQTGGFLEIEYKGTAYRVRAVHELPDTQGGLHHYMLELIYS